MQIRFSNERHELWEAGWSCPCGLRKTWYSIEESNPHWEKSKILDKIYRNYPCLFFPLQSPVNAFISSFYFYVDIENIPTRIISLNISFSIVKNTWKAKADFNHAPSVIKISFKGKGFACDHTNLNRFIHIKNIAVTLCICYKIVLTIVIVIKCAINFQCDCSIGCLCNLIYR